jgi:hypothetical protein
MGIHLKKVGLKIFKITPDASLKPILPMERCDQRPAKEILRP